VLHFYQVYTIWGIYLKELNNDSKIKYIYFASCYIFGCAFKYVNLKTRFELKKKLRQKKRIYACSGPSLHPTAHLTRATGYLTPSHLAQSSFTSRHLSGHFSAPFLFPTRMMCGPHRSVWPHIAHTSVLSASPTVGWATLARDSPARMLCLGHWLVGPLLRCHLPSDKAEVVTKQRDRSRRDWSLARSDSTRIRLSPYLIKLTIRDPISGCVDNSKPPSSPGREVHAKGDFCAAVMVPQFHGCPMHVAWSGMNASSCANLLRCHRVDRATIADSIARWRQGSAADPPPPWAGIFHSLIPPYGATTSFDVFYSLQSAKPRGRLHRGSPIMPSPANHGRDGWAAPPWVVWEWRRGMCRWFLDRRPWLGVRSRWGGIDRSPWIMIAGLGKDQAS
jgi:hypothetical protein